MSEGKRNKFEVDDSLISTIRESYEELVDWLNLLLVAPHKFNGELYKKSSLLKGGMDLQQVSKVLVAKEDMKGKVYTRKIKHLYGENEVAIKNNFNSEEIEKFNKWRKTIKEQLQRLNHKNNLPSKKETRIEDLSKAELVDRYKQLEFQLRRSLIS